MKHVTEFLKLFSGCTLCLFRIHYWIYAELSRIRLYKNQTCSFSSSVAEWNNFFFFKYPFHLSSKGKVPKKASFEKSARQSSDLGGGSVVMKVRWGQETLAQLSAQHQLSWWMCEVTRVRTFMGFVNVLTKAVYELSDLLCLLLLSHSEWSRDPGNRWEEACDTFSLS